MAPSNDGFLLLDSELNLIGLNGQALQILCFPSEMSRMKQPKVFIADRVRNTLLDPDHWSERAFVKEFSSGKRRYICRVSQVECGRNDSVRPAFAVVLERDASRNSSLTEFSARFGLTRREGETVDLLLQGLTSKEIGTRLQISPNTVKAFIRLVMVKLKVSTRSGIAGKFAGSRAESPHLIVESMTSQSPREYPGA
jgi:DNA-binding CsgD family transcriptional regulator